jgi:hypothetical protein
MGTLTARDLPAEIAYRIDERLGMMGYECREPVPEDVENSVRREVHALVSKTWPEAYREAVELGIVMP